MFNGPDFPKSLDEEIFTQWIEKGREGRMGYAYLLIVWDAYDATYRAVYVQSREEIDQYEKYPAAGRESLIAAYDLYSESKVA